MLAQLLVELFWVQPLQSRQSWQGRTVLCNWRKLVLEVRELLARKYHRHNMTLGVALAQFHQQFRNAGISFCRIRTIRETFYKADCISKRLWLQEQ